MVNQTAQNVNPMKVARYHVRYGGWYIFPTHAPVFDGAGNLVGCTCEAYRRSPECKKDHPHLYLGPDGHCAQPGKCPAVKWSKRSTQDDDQLIKWWSRPWLSHPDTPGMRYYPGFGGDCGKSGKLTLDDDAYKAGYAGGDFVERLDEKTVGHVTGSGGAHRVYAMPADRYYTNAATELPDGIDIRGYGGYVVLPGSLHHTGNTYEFAPGCAPHQVPYIEVPFALQEILDQAHSNRPGEDAGPSDAQAVNESLDHVERLLAAANIAHSEAQAWDGDGRRLILQDCPFNPQDDPHPKDAAAFVVVYRDGKIGAGCHHARCQKVIAESGGNGWAFVKDKAGGGLIVQLRRARAWVRSAGGIQHLKDAEIRRPTDYLKSIDAVLEIAIMKGAPMPQPGLRRLAEAAGVSHQTAKNHLRRMAEIGLWGLSKDSATGGYRVDLRPLLDHAVTFTQCAGTGEGGVNVTKSSGNGDFYADHRAGDAWRIGFYTHAVKRRQVAPLAQHLGSAALLIWATLESAGAAMTVYEVAEVTGLSAGAARRSLKRLESAGLLVVWQGRPYSYELHPNAEERLHERTPAMTSYGMGALNAYRNAGTKAAWADWNLRLRVERDDREIEILKNQREKGDAQAVIWADTLDGMGINPKAKVRPPRPQNLLRNDPASEWELLKPLWEEWQDLADLPDAQRRYYVTMAGWESEDVDRMLYLAQRVGKQQRNFIGVGPPAEMAA